MTDTRSRVLAALDRYDIEHETSGCPARPGECIHSTTTALRAVLASRGGWDTAAAALGIAMDDNPPTQR